MMLFLTWHHAKDLGTWFLWSQIKKQMKKQKLLTSGLAMMSENPLTKKPGVSSNFSNAQVESCLHVFMPCSFKGSNHLGRFDHLRMLLSGHLDSMVIVLYPLHHSDSNTCVQGYICLWRGYLYRWLVNMWNITIGISGRVFHRIWHGFVYLKGWSDENLQFHFSLPSTSYGILSCGPSSQIWLFH